MTRTDPTDIDTTVAHEARMYDYWLGGKDNYPSDRELGDRIKGRIPSIEQMARANRDFMVRAVRYLTGEVGIRQFLDIGTGIPAAPNVHEVAQGIDPRSRVLYVDNDALVLAHARARMTGTAQGRAAFLHGDFRDPGAILGSDRLRDVLDLDEPVALLLVAVLMYFDPAEGTDPYLVVTRLLDALPSGSHLVITHPTGDFDPEAMAAVYREAKRSRMTILARTRDEVTRFFDGTDLVPPGVVPVSGWPSGAPDETPPSAYYWAGVGRKP